MSRGGVELIDFVDLTLKEKLMVLNWRNSNNTLQLYPTVHIVLLEYTRNQNYKHIHSLDFEIRR